MKRTLQNRRGSVLMEFILVIPIFIALIAWVVVNVQYVRACVRLESFQRSVADSCVTRGVGDKRINSMYDRFTAGNAGAGVFKK